MAAVLHDYELDPDGYAVRLFFALIGAPYERRAVNVHPGREHDSAAFRRLSPRGTLPVLVEADAAIHGAGAILFHLARTRPSAARFLPDAPFAEAAVVEWLLFATAALAPAKEARLNEMIGTPAAPDAAARAASAFRVMDDHMIRRGLDGFEWFAADEPTIADIALFPPVALSRDFGIDHDEYPGLRRWMRRVRRLPGFITMPGVPDYF